MAFEGTRQLLTNMILNNIEDKRKRESPEWQLSALKLKDYEKDRAIVEKERVIAEEERLFAKSKDEARRKLGVYTSDIRSSVSEQGSDVTASEISSFGDRGINRELLEPGEYDKAIAPLKPEKGYAYKKIKHEDGRITHELMLSSEELARYGVERDIDGKLSKMKDPEKLKEIEDRNVLNREKEKLIFKVNTETGQIRTLEKQISAIQKGFKGSIEGAGASAEKEIFDKFGNNMDKFDYVMTNTNTLPDGWNMAKGLKMRSKYSTQREAINLWKRVIEINKKIDQGAKRINGILANAFSGSVSEEVYEDIPVEEGEDARTYARRLSKMGVPEDQALQMINRAFSSGRTGE